MIKKIPLYQPSLSKSEKNNVVSCINENWISSKGRFIKKFDETRYNNIIVNMNKLMKIYIYILSDRYEINSYLPIFNDIKDNILELLYSIIFVVPDKFKHIYGFNPYQEIEKSTKDFILKYNIMLKVLINYGNIEKKYPHINYEKYKPYEKNKEHYLP